jgi:hypothetical protein
MCVENAYGSGFNILQVIDFLTRLQRNSDTIKRMLESAYEAERNPTTKEE